MLNNEKNYIVKSYSNAFEIQDENRSLGMMEREILKNTSMIDAQKQAKKVEEELNEQVVSIVVDEAKDNIDSETEEKKEKTEKSTSNVVEAQQEVKEMMSKMNMLEEDIKGITVDDNR